MTDPDQQNPYAEANEWVDLHTQKFNLYYWTLVYGYEEQQEEWTGEGLNPQSVKIALRSVLTEIFWDNHSNPGPPQDTPAE